MPGGELFRDLRPCRAGCRVTDRSRRIRPGPAGISVDSAAAGFGVAGGTAIGLIAITSSYQWMQDIYQRWHAAIWEKISVLVFIVLAVITLSGLELPHGELGALFSGGILPILNILVAVKVALGSWAVVLIFIRYRGLL